MPLFYKSSYDWLNQDNIVEFVRKIAAIREDYKDLITDPNPETLNILETDNENVIAFERVSAEKSLTILLNTNLESSEQAKINLVGKKGELKDKLTGKTFSLKDDKLNIALDKGEIIIF